MADLDMVRGDTAVWDVAVSDAAGAALNLTGWVLRFTAKAAFSDADPGVLQVSSAAANDDGAITVTNAATGAARIALSRAATASLAPPRKGLSLFYDLQASRDSPPETFTVARGTLVVWPDVTITT